jgi:hypothetical protein
MSKEPDAEFDRLVRKIIKDTSYLHFLTFSLDENLKSIKPAISTVTKFKETYDSKHSERELHMSMADLLNNISYASIFTQNAKREAMTLQK